MEIIKVKNYQKMSQVASGIILNSISKKPSLVLGLASGHTTLGLYKNLAKACKEKKADFSKIKAFNLDEHYPVKKVDKKSYNYYFFKNLFRKVNIKESSINLLNGETKNPEKECEDYEDNIRKNKIDIQILGIGENGHIAFNEPGSSRSSRTRLVNLTHIKGKALTMGVATIMQAKKIILLASGKKKAKAVRSMVKGKISKKCPASFLRNHRSLTIILDKGASSML